MNARTPVDLQTSLKMDEDSNQSSNPSFDAVLSARLSRRGLLRGSVGTVGTAMLGGVALTACGGGDDAVITPVTPTETLLGFDAVAKSLADVVVVPPGYSTSVLYALGDPLTATTPAYKNDGTDTDFENRAGDHHDGMEWFGLDTAGKPSLTSTDRGLLAMNHEATTDETRSSFFLHADGGTTTLPRPASEVDKETAIHGISVVEVKSTSGKWATVPASAFNFRLTSLSENIQLTGPARGNSLMVTKYSNDGTKTRGTLNNCGTGKTPWGTFLTGEENWAGYFTRSATDDTTRGGATAKSVVALKRYGRNAGSGSRHGWESAGTADKYARWDISQGTGAATDDYRNEINTFGYIVEIDAYDKTKTARKRTALGRFAHESAAFGKLVVGQPLAVYMGDDSRGEYIYKFVSTKTWVAADANPTDRITTGDTYLDAGKLYAAKFNSDGTGDWIELSISNTLIANFATYDFADQADVLVNARLAADAVGATKMDRPEWCSTNVANGEIYFTLTNNSNRAVNSATMPPDSANPRVYADIKNGTSTQNGNPNGHVLRVKEGTVGNAATGFSWDVYVFGAESSAAPGTVNLSSLTDDQDFSSPDGLVFSPATGIMWIQTDDGAYTDVSNCMMVAALPGTVGDGAKKTLTYAATAGTLTVDTYVGKAPGADNLKRFLVGPKACEITGLCETPDGKAMFINVQHPGETTAQADIADATKYTSQWPSNAGYGAGKRPRSATIVITKNDGGRIGS
ncbi:MAG: PhoX family phosphatase [Hydrogenophaga sp.]|uniref:PhoX family protein n=1 Tax=Hydrogenophaga sp. TaxID=1904254 RepID=UPI00271A0FA9|nr:PhoX family phosphatase [Hydrogenophaga sp.]MDO9567765.1 PhoX family phosphatase [Hydrogenophaga sp.]MDP3375493.1 PhoX family phosphatase [Hydrogenophaga sp.]